jgi:fused signal recognition particle receptor
MFGFKPGKKPPVDEISDAGQGGGLFASLRARLSRTRSTLSEGLADAILGKKEIDEDLLEDVETRLLMGDVGVEATRRIVDSVSERVRRKELRDPAALFRGLHDAMSEILAPCEVTLEIPTEPRPFVILVLGVNGAGKTTTIAKLAHRFKVQGLSVMLAAGDTFRAAAVEQLQTWGQRHEVPVIAQGTGADAASVVFDALQAARARGIDVLIADTAGRLHTQSNLMDELKKIKRVIGKLDSQAPHEVLLVLDAGIGQNALMQARAFHEALGVTGLALTKLDGTAKGGILFSIAQELGLPIRFIGVGETARDLRPFEVEEFVNAVLEQPTTQAA